MTGSFQIVMTNIFIVNISEVNAQACAYENDHLLARLSGKN